MEHSSDSGIAIKAQNVHAVMFADPGSECPALTEAFGLPAHLQAVLTHAGEDRRVELFAYLFRAGKIACPPPYANEWGFAWAARGRASSDDLAEMVAYARTIRPELTATIRDDLDPLRVFRAHRSRADLREWSWGTDEQKVRCFAS